jgi:hypothetical protein
MIKNIKILRQEIKQRGDDIETLAKKVIELSNIADNQRKELIKIKSHWTYKLIHWKW